MLIFDRGTSVQWLRDAKHENPLPNLKGESHEIKVWFFWALWIAKILFIFPQKGFSSLYKRFNVLF